MGSAHQLTNIGGISSVIKSYWLENMQLLFGFSIKSKHEFEWCKVNY